MRLVAVLAVACLATQSSQAVPLPAPLDPEPGLARSGCVAVLDTVDVMLRNPPAEMARRMVEVPGYATPQLFTSTEAFVEETLRAVCGSLLLAQYKKTRSFWGEPLWTEDMVPDYKQSKPVEPRLADLCRRMVRSRRRSITASIVAGQFAGVACDGIIGKSPPDDVVGQLKAIAAVVLTDVSASSWRLLPFAIVAIALPFVLRPLVIGTPPLPEPRGPAEPGDADYDGADTDVVGCVSGFAGSAAVLRKGKLPR